MRGQQVYSSQNKTLKVAEWGRFSFRHLLIHLTISRKKSIYSAIIQTDCEAIAKSCANERSHACMECSQDYPNQTTPLVSQYTTMHDYCSTVSPKGWQNTGRGVATAKPRYRCPPAIQALKGRQTPKRPSHAHIAIPPCSA